MKLGIASDHRGYNLKEQIKKILNDKQYEMIDCGANSTESSDHTDYAFLLGEKVKKHEVDYGIAICGTGIGMSIACNKVKGVRCAKVDSREDVIATRKDNDSNIISFGEKMPIEEAIDLITLFINTPCSMEERYVRRRNKLKEYEEKKDD